MWPLDLLKKLVIPRDLATFELFVRQVLKVVFWVAIVAPVILIPLYFLAISLAR